MGDAYLDGVASIAIGLLLMSMAFILASETKGLLLGEGVDAATLADIRRRVESDPAILRATDILTMYMGPHDLLVNLCVYFKPGIPVEEIHNAIHRIEDNIQGAYPECAHVYIKAQSLAKPSTA